jgi:hypothetical protein
MTREPIRLPTITTIYDALLLAATTHRAMTPLHPKWGEFLDTLWPLRRYCLGQASPRAFAITEGLLTAFRCDQPSSLVALQALGGHCDCTVVLNAAEATPEDFPSMVESALRIWSGEPVPPPPRIPRTPIHAPEEDAR